MLKYFLSYKNLHALKLLCLLLVMLLFYSCNPAKYVPRDETLLYDSEEIGRAHV